jgi:hypothetical protein|tara:strand:+ start:151 stop:381 length:231 start_codon:yes stop_codon:yes gene_type:complete
MAKQCCADCTDAQRCGSILEPLSTIAGHDILDNCDCECDENVKRQTERQGLHANPDIDTSAAEEEAKEAEEEVEEE